MFIARAVRLMNSKTTWICVAVAALVFAFIFFVDVPLRRKLNAARSTEIFPTFKTNAAVRIDIWRAGGNFISVVRTNNSWLLTKPFVYPAAAEQVEALLNALAGLNWQTQITAAELKDHPKAQEEFGFDAPLASVSVENGDVNLQLGANTPVGQQVYAQVVGSPEIYVIDSEFLKSLPRTANDWRDPYLFRFSSRINTIKSRSGNKSFSLVFTNGSWRLPQARADNEKISKLLEKTAEIQVARFESDDPQADLEQFGLQAPEMELSFAYDTNVLATLLVGKTPTNDASVVFAKLQNQNYIYRIPKDTLAQWRAPVTNFVDRHLVSLTTNDFSRIAQMDIRGAETFSLLRSGEKWTLPGAPDFPVDSDLVREVLKTLSRAEVDIEKDVVTDFASYGLAPPALEYTLKKFGAESNSIVAQIDFGTNQPGKVFVRRLDEYSDTVNSIRPEEYQRLPRATWQFRDRHIWNFTTNEVASVTIHQNGRERKIIRNAKNEWSFAAGSQGILNTFAFDEAMFRLGHLKAVFWVSPDDKNPEHYGFKKADHRIEIELRRGGKTQMLSLEFGDFLEYGTRYAATMLDGSRAIFEFPWAFFSEVQDSLSIPQ